MYRVLLAVLLCATAAQAVPENDLCASLSHFVEEKLRSLPKLPSEQPSETPLGAESAIEYWLAHIGQRPPDLSAELKEFAALTVLEDKTDFVRLLPESRYRVEVVSASKRTQCFREPASVVPLTRLLNHKIIELDENAELRVDRQNAFLAEHLTNAVLARFLVLLPPAVDEEVARNISRYFFEDWPKFSQYFRRIDISSEGVVQGGALSGMARNIAEFLNQTEEGMDLTRIVLAKSRERVENAAFAAFDYLRQTSCNSLENIQTSSCRFRQRLNHMVEDLVAQRAVLADSTLDQVCASERLHENTMLVQKLFSSYAEHVPEKAIVPRVQAYCQLVVEKPRVRATVLPVKTIAAAGLTVLGVPSFVGLESRAAVVMTLAGAFATVGLTAKDFINEVKCRLADFRAVQGLFWFQLADQRDLIRTSHEFKRASFRGLLDLAASFLAVTSATRVPALNNFARSIYSSVSDYITSSTVRSAGWVVFKDTGKVLNVIRRRATDVIVLGTGIQMWNAFTETAIMPLVNQSRKEGAILLAPVASRLQNILENLRENAETTEAIRTKLSEFSGLYRGRDSAELEKLWTAFQPELFQLFQRFNKTLRADIREGRNLFKEWVLFSPIDFAARDTIFRDSFNRAQDELKALIAAGATRPLNSEEVAKKQRLQRDVEVAEKRVALNLVSWKLLEFLYPEVYKQFNDNAEDINRIFAYFVKNMHFDYFIEEFRQVVDQVAREINAEILVYSSQIPKS